MPMHHSIKKTVLRIVIWMDNTLNLSTYVFHIPYMKSYEILTFALYIHTFKHCKYTIKIHEQN